MHVEGMNSPLTVLAGLGYTVRASTLRISQSGLCSPSEFTVQAYARGSGRGVKLCLPLVHVISIYTMPEAMPLGCAALRDMIARYVLVLLWRPDHPLLVDPSIEMQFSHWRTRCSRRITQWQLGLLNIIDRYGGPDSPAIAVPKDCATKPTVSPNPQSSPCSTVGIAIRLCHTTMRLHIIFFLCFDLPPPIPIFVFVTAILPVRKSTKRKLPPNVSHNLYMLPAAKRARGRGGEPSAISDVHPSSAKDKPSATRDISVRHPDTSVKGPSRIGDARLQDPPSRGRCTSKTKAHRSIPRTNARVPSPSPRVATAHVDCDTQRKPKRAISKPSERRAPKEPPVKATKRACTVEPLDAITRSKRRRVERAGGRDLH
ncbi:hypothetical protein L227DRAFT_126919 [Lentinus tigrinus ALCF2SS1-6]|uniref:Uncharacterized protein n=1 Tax=Lentinus tigrinus ALCF2SS1-6 TaxID=1328759 RepID=A0A5C2SQM8_9APHY|nr:hypothetical protein L227DRAFT_126919 [Lentinus tigrinus ALCF2SS1-6]